MKKLPKRLENAVTKLYNAFHEGTLDALDCTHCAVGNMCNNSNQWSLYASYVNWLDGGRNTAISLKTGYDFIELEEVENVFLDNCFTKDGFQTKETQFKGLCAVVKYLCELDGVENIMEIQSLFEFDENKKPINQLTF